MGVDGGEDGEGVVGEGGTAGGEAATVVQRDLDAAARSSGHAGRIKDDHAAGRVKSSSAEVHLPPPSSSFLLLSLSPRDDEGERYPDPVRLEEAVSSYLHPRPSLHRTAVRLEPEDPSGSKRYHPVLARCQLLHFASPHVHQRRDQPVLLLLNPQPVVTCASPHKHSPSLRQRSAELTPAHDTLHLLLLQISSDRLGDPLARHIPMPQLPSNAEPPAERYPLPRPAARMPEATRHSLHLYLLLPCLVRIEQHLGRSKLARS
mmetsp:Transcript_20042/g.45627  ORF Transcript_20042/g.45627 Transcript_20042/m.45627 type:complete len:261 (-) Transcript_20042:606-1388(-)|eukprot:12309-Hanusia_phi.AAC.2